MAEIGAKLMEQGEKRALPWPDNGVATTGTAENLEERWARSRRSRRHGIQGAVQ